MARKRRLLYATDFSPASGPAFARALELARANRGELLIVHALAPLAPISAGDGYIPPKTYDEIERSARAYAERRLGSLVKRARTAGVRAIPLLVEGTPWQAITRAAKNRGAGTIVMGTHGRSGLAKLFLGSVAERVIATAQCPVMTVRGR
jgi:universal stress protein A